MENNIIIKNLKTEIKKLKKENCFLIKLAFVDNLTQVYNRNWFYQFIKYNEKHFLTIIDLNNLKKVNDKEGHIAGDDYIKCNVKIFKNYDTVIRYGGDEFIVLSKDEERFKKLNSLNNISFCCGGVHINEFENIAQAIELADKRLYNNKKK